MSRHHSQPVSPHVHGTGAVLTPPGTPRATSGLRTCRLDGADQTSMERMCGVAKAWHSCVVSDTNDIISRACYTTSGQPLRIVLQASPTRRTRLFVSSDAAESVCSQL